MVRPDESRAGMRAVPIFVTMKLRPAAVTGTEHSRTSMQSDSGGGTRVQHPAGVFVSGGESEGEFLPGVDFLIGVHSQHLAWSGRRQRGSLRVSLARGAVLSGMAILKSSLQRELLCEFAAEAAGTFAGVAVAAGTLAGIARERLREEQLQRE